MSSRVIDLDYDNGYEPHAYKPVNAMDRINHTCGCCGDVRKDVRSVDGPHEDVEYRRCIDCCPDGEKVGRFE